MKRALLRFFTFLLFAFSLILIFGVFSGAEDVIPENAPSLELARGFALYNIENDTYIISKNASLSVDPASTVKIMSGLIICESLSGREAETVTVTSEMIAGTKGKSFGLVPGNTLTVKDLMICAFSGGYNDAVNVLACLVAGNTESFLKLMNERAELLGLRGTYYANATGLDDPLMSTTLSDTVKLAAAASRIKLFLDVSSYFTYTVSFGDTSQRTVYGSNLILDKNSAYFCRSARGMNSGMTDGGGACLVTYATHGGAEYIAVAMGCPDSDGRFALVQDALQYAYDNYSYKVYLEKGSGVGSVDIALSDAGGSVSAVLLEDLVYFSRNGELFEDFKIVICFYSDDLKAPVTSNDRIGYCALWSGDTLYSVAEIGVKNDVPKSLFLSYIDSVQRYITGRAFLSTLAFSVILTLLSVFLPRVTLGIRQKRRTHVRTRDGFKLKK